MGSPLTEAEIAEAFNLILHFTPKQRSFVVVGSHSSKSPRDGDSSSRHRNPSPSSATTMSTAAAATSAVSLTLTQLLAFVRGTSFQAQQTSEYTESMVSKMFHATTQRSHLTLAEVVQAANTSTLQGSLSMSAADGAAVRRKQEVTFGAANATATGRSTSPPLSSHNAYAHDWQNLLRRALTVNKINMNNSVSVASSPRGTTTKTAALTGSSSPRRRGVEPSSSSAVVKLPQIIHTLKLQRHESQLKAQEHGPSAHPSWSVHSKVTRPGETTARSAGELEQIPTNATEEFRDPFDALRVNREGKSLLAARQEQQSEWLHKRKQVQPDQNGAVVIPACPRNAGAPVVIVDATTEQQKAADAKRKQEEICRTLAIKFGAPEGAVKVSKGANPAHSPRTAEEALKERQLYVNTMTNIVGFLSSPRGAK